MFHIIGIFGNRVFGFLFNLLVIPFCVINGKDGFVKFYILSMIVKSLFDSSALYYPISQKLRGTEIHRTLSVIFQYRIVILILFIPFILLHDNYTSIVFVLACTLNMEYHFNLENDTPNLFVQSNLVKFFISIIVFFFDFENSALINIYIFCTFIVSLHGFIFVVRKIKLKLDIQYFGEFKQLFYLTFPAVLNYGSREFSTYLMYENLSKNIIFQDRIQKSFSSITSSLAPIGAAFPEKFRSLFFRKRSFFLLVIPFLLFFSFVTYIFIVDLVILSTLMFAVSILLGSINFILFYIYFIFEGRFKGVYYLNLFYSIVGFLLIYTMHLMKLYDFFPLVMLCQEFLLLFAILFFIKSNIDSNWN